MKRALPNDKPLGEPKMRFEDTFSAEQLALSTMDAPQNVWIVCDAYNYEGYGAPLAVFSTEDAARKYAADVMKQEYPPDSAEAFERVIDIAGSINS